MFYEQYLSIAIAGFINLIFCLVPTFVVCFILLGMDLRSGLINLLTIIMIVVDTVGAMTLWGVSYNAISLINLVTVSYTWVYSVVLGQNFGIGRVANSHLGHSWKFQDVVGERT